MGRHRKHDKHLPQHMHFKHGSYYFVYAGKWTKIGNNQYEAFNAYSKLITPGGRIVTMSQLFDRYVAEILPGKALETQKGNINQFKYLRSYFGDMRPDTIQPTDIYSYMDLREAKVSANREKALLSHVFMYAIRWGICQLNPCQNVKNFKEQARDRLVSSDEIKAIFSIAKPVMKLIIEFAITTGLRQKDILNFRRSQIIDDGLDVTHSKTGKSFLIEWNDRLRRLIAKAVEASGNHDYLFLNEGNTPYTSSGFQSNWKRLIKKALDEDLITEPFRFHDLRAVAVTNAYEKMGLQAASDVAGHTGTALTKRVYVRSKQRMKLPEY